MAPPARVRPAQILTTVEIFWAGAFETSRKKQQAWRKNGERRHNSINVGNSLLAREPIKSLPQRRKHIFWRGNLQNRFETSQLRVQGYYESVSQKGENAKRKIGERGRLQNTSSYGKRCFMVRKKSTALNNKIEPKKGEGEKESVRGEQSN